MFGPHPYAHLTVVQKLLFYTYIHCPHSDFMFDVDNWVIRSRPGIVEPDNYGVEEVIVFNNPSDYFSLARELGAQPIMSIRNAERYGGRLIDMGPEHVRQIGRSLRVLHDG